jgi:glycine/D-amino acid oxidase-like deaminating enzyme
MAESLRIWPELDQRVGHSTGFQKCGIVFTNLTDAETEYSVNWLKYIEGMDVEARILTPKEYLELFPGTTLPVKSGLYTPGDAHAEPTKAAPAIALGARAKGAHILTECAVRGLDTAAGRVSGVFTERGRIACSSVVLAGGAWSGYFLGNLDIRLPQLSVLNSVMHTAPLDGPTATVWTRPFAARKREDGGYTIASGDANIADVLPDSFRFLFDYIPVLLHEWKAVKVRFSTRFFEALRFPRHWRMDEETAFEYFRNLDPVPSRKILDKVFAAAGEIMPVFRQARVVKRWGGLIDTVPDAVPVISGIAEVPGLFVATGFSGHGFGIGPAAGRLAANLVTGEKPIVDPTPFRFTRFSDGSKIHIEVGF